MSTKLALRLTWLGIVMFAAGYAIAASNRGPNSLPGCIFNSTPPTLTDGQVTILQCDVNGNLKTKAQ